MFFLGFLHLEVLGNSLLGRCCSPGICYMPKIKLENDSAINHCVETLLFIFYL